MLSGRVCVIDVTLFVLAPPFIWDSGQPMSSGVEENVTLRCHARGYPKPTFFWITPEGYFVNATKPIYEIEFLDDDSKRLRGKMLQNDGSLLLFNTRVHDSGVYKCVAANVAGESESSVNVTVTEGELLVSYRLTVFPFLENYDHRTWPQQFKGLILPLIQQINHRPLDKENQNLLSHLEDSYLSNGQFYTADKSLATGMDKYYHSLVGS